MLSLFVVRQRTERRPLRRSTTGIIKLPHDSPEAFQAFNYYVYHKDLALKRGEENDEDLSQQIQLAFQVWVLGDKYNMTGMQNCVMVRICELLHLEAELKVLTLALAFQETMPGSPLRHLAVEYVVNQVVNNHKSIHDFDDLGALDGYATELFETQRAFQDEGPYGFPRYSRLMQNKELFQVTGSNSQADRTGPEKGVSTCYTELDCDGDQFDRARPEESSPWLLSTVDTFPADSVDPFDEMASYHGYPLCQAMFGEPGYDNGRQFDPRGSR